MATIRDAGITGDFVHEPLQDPENDIRLVQVDLSGERDGEIHCTITPYAVDKAPPYVAISYTWGDMSFNRSISVNGKQLCIGLNSWKVLWQARLHQLTSPLWMDVLSIDQANDVEKGIQVGMMGRIYKTAVYTFVSLGSHENDSGFLAEQIHAHTNYIKQRRIQDAELYALGCSACGRQLGNGVYRCRQCGESVRFCTKCVGAREHEGPEHSVLDYDRAEFRFESGCVECGQALSSNFYELRHNRGHRYSMVCWDCAQAHLEGLDGESWRAQYVLTDELRSMGRSDVEMLQVRLQTASRLYDLAQETHQRIADALSLFSLRAYFTRLWIIQEVRQARSVVIACGDSLFGYVELGALVHDVLLKPQLPAHQIRWRNMIRRHISQFLDVFLAWMDGSTVEASHIWSLVDTFKSSRCYDPRDRVFGLLALVHEEEATSLRPDYTKSVTDVVLQLIEVKIEHDERVAASYSRVVDASLQYVHRAYEFNFLQAFDLIREFYLNSDAVDVARNRIHSGAGFHDVAAMLQRRRETRNERDNSPQCWHLDSSSRLDDSRYFTMIVDSSCKIRRHAVDGYIVPLVRPGTLARDFHIDGEDTSNAISLRSPSGTVLAFADSKTQPGDILLFLHNSDTTEGLMAPVPGLVVRLFENDIYSLVGQFICDDGVKTCPGADKNDRRVLDVDPDNAWPLEDESDDTHEGAEEATLYDGECECKGRHASHSLNGRPWKLRMSPEDLLLFVSQDLKLAHKTTQSGKFEEHVVNCTSVSIERARRLVTKVTSEAFSSYATLENWSTQKGFQSLTLDDEIPEFLPPWR